LVAGVAIAVLPGAQSGEPAAAQSASPNIVLITTDDQTFESLRVMKRTRRLMVEGGTSFARSYASFPLCCPARATWLTGQYAHNHGVLQNAARNGGGYGALREPGKVLPVWLKAAGYDTAFVGKWLHGYEGLERPPGWDVWWGLSQPSMVRYYDYEVADSLGGSTAFGSSDAHYQTDLLTNRYAVPYIGARARQGPLAAPFFLHVSYIAPHWGSGRADAAGRRCAGGLPFAPETARAKPAPRHAKHFRRAPLPSPHSFNERDVSDKPRYLRSKPIGRAAERAISERYRCSLAALLSADEAVARIHDALQVNGLADETVVILTSDNGYMNGEHRVPGEKSLPYEEAIHVPMLISGRGIPAGLEVGAPVADVDLAPTILALANAHPPDDLSRPLDGRSLTPYLAGQSDSARAVLIEAKRALGGPEGGPYVSRSWIGLRTKRYTYVEHYRARGVPADLAPGLPIAAGERTDVELYDERRDPFQLDNHAWSEAYVPVRRALASELGEMRACAGRTCEARLRVPRPRAR
jgi:arylsulfatase A-like enzyme